MFLNLITINCIESIYDPRYGKENFLFGMKQKGQSQQYDNINWEKEIKNEFDDNLMNENKKESNYNDINDYDEYKNELYDNNQSNTTQYEVPFKFDSLISHNKTNYNNPINFPQQQSISRSILFTNKNSLPMILNKEFNDISQDLNNKLTSSIYNNNRRNNIDHDKYRELIVIKKRVLSDGKHKIVDLDVSGRVVPRNNQESGLRLFLACVIFLLACVLFTASMKFYKSYLRIKKIDPFIPTN